MAVRPVSLTAYWHLLRSNRNFRLLWAAQIISELGDWFYSISIYSLLLNLTGSAKAVALAVVLQVLPQFFIAPMAGVINDRLSRRRVMILADLGRAVIVLGMLFIRTPEMVPLAYVILLLQTFLWGFFEPGRSAVIPNLVVGDDETLVANALSSTTWSFSLMAGSALGGLVAVAFGHNTVFVVNSLTFLASALCIRAMNFHEPHASVGEPFRARDLINFSPVLEGIRYVRSYPRLLAVLLVKFGLGLMGANWVIIPILGERVFPLQLGELDPKRAAMLGMSALMGARGVGALIGPLIGGYWAGHDRVRIRRGILIGFLAITAGYCSLSFAPHIVPAMLAVILAHAGGSTIWVFSTTLLHIHAADRFRGRVFSTDFAMLVVTMSLANYIAGVALDMGVGVRLVCLISGLIALAPATLWLFVGMPLWKGETAEESSGQSTSRRSGS